MVNNLIILGNGFDLKLGLATSFKDYFDNVYENVLPLVEKKEKIDFILERFFHYMDTQKSVAAPRIYVERLSETVDEFKKGSK